jgi:V8-like Glu-specific endopeptidase
MKKWVVLSCLGLSFAVHAGNPVVYGIDNRIDTIESSNPLYQKLASSTAARILLSNIREEGNNAFITAETLAQNLDVCPEAKFARQTVAADCSGTLIAPDLVVTAGHCMMSHGACPDYAWVFNYKVRNQRQSGVTVRIRDLYRCKAVQKLDMNEGHDYALVQLDREVENVSPVKVASTLPGVGTPVLTIGNPSGLPQKIADGANVKSTTETEFKANLDTFNKGSGSPVFHARTGELLGVLVRGEKDYVQDKNRNCYIPNNIPDSSPGEDVSSSVQFYHEFNSAP